MTPAEELWQAVKEHATADLSFEFIGGDHPTLYVNGRKQVNVGRLVERNVWFEDVHGLSGGTYTHDSASSAVYSAFLRARK